MPFLSLSLAARHIGSIEQGTDVHWTTQNYIDRKDEKRIFRIISDYTITNEDEEVENIYLHICDEEGKEFTGMTTFHGMSGYILANYARTPTFIRKSTEKLFVKEVIFVLCSSNTLKFLLVAVMHFRIRCTALNTVNEMISCSKETISFSNNCINIKLKSISNKISIGFEQVYADDLQIIIPSGDDNEVIYLRPGYHHSIQVVPTEVGKCVNRLNISRSRCVVKWSELYWTNYSLPVIFEAKPYTFKRCEQLRYAYWSHQKYGCIPNNTGLVAEPLCEGVLILDRPLQKAFLGGGTSLFMGCSCVTMMETFIFLLKLVIQSITKESDYAEEKDEQKDFFAFGIDVNGWLESIREYVRLELS
uniref:Amiloride-sensitive sodium channel n=1 Tax=Heterorhabditis bacteriophora TaxID=37862 RepID=A0A1I7X2W9_HETBA